MTLSATAPVVVTVDPRDERLLRAFWENEQAAQRAGRSWPVLRTYAAFATMVRDPSPYYARLLLAAMDGDDLVGGVEVSWALRENTHLGELEVNVRPDRWRRGTGRLLHDAALDRLRAESRTTVIGEACEGPAGEGSAVPFARALGYASAHLEHHLVLQLRRGADVARRRPVDDPRYLDGQGDGQGEGRGDGYGIVTWTGRCPDEHLAAYVAMRNQMEVDVPSGTLDLQPVLLDEKRVRTSEERTARSYHRLVSAAVRASDRTMVGYSELFLPHGEFYAQQDDTLVMPDHRGHRLGLRLKQANLDRLRTHHPERHVLHTWTAPDNAAMIRTNERLGFTVVERMHEMQRTLAG